MSDDMKGGTVNRFLANYSDIALAAMVLAIVGMMIVPLPTFLLDLLLSFNIATAITLLLISLYIPNALRISAFPSILLITTLFRLALNVSSTRLILLQADAGAVIDAFGEFVVSGNYVVGAVIFLILTIIQFLVIAKGSERVSEVAARFTLDAMPGKQMSIDADLRAGAISQKEAHDARFEIQRESQLYGAMDGAMKFVKGDAVAAIIITSINIIAGMVVGVVQLDMGATEAAEIYTLLTIGDGLVSQIPALLIATTSGIIVTRVASTSEDTHLGSDIFSQIFAHPKALAIAGALLFGLGLVPGLPTAPFLILGAALGAVAFALYRAERVRDLAEDAEGTEPMFPSVSPLSIDIGVGLSARLDEDDQKLSQRITSVREAVFSELGVTIPKCLIRNNRSTIEEHAFQISIDESRVAQFSVLPGRRMSLASTADLLDLKVDGLPVFEPLGGTLVTWISEDDVEEVERAGFDVLETSRVVLNYLTAEILRHADEFVGVQEVRNMLDQLQTTAPVVVTEVTPELLSLTELTEVLSGLVEEQVSIRQLKQILAILADRARSEKRPKVLIESVREGLSRYISQKYAEPSGLNAYVIDSGIEEMIASSIRASDTGSYLALAPQVSREILTAVDEMVSDDIARGERPVVITDQRVRRFVRRLVALQHPEIAVLSFQEIDPDVPVVRLGEIAIGHAPS